MGVTALREPDAKALGSGLFELRVSGRDGISRAIYVTRQPSRVTIVLVFAKKTQKTPKNVLETARKRAREV